MECSCQMQVTGSAVFTPCGRRIIAEGKGVRGQESWAQGPDRTAEVHSTVSTAADIEAGGRASPTDAPHHLIRHLYIG
jgi:hypothetical protein